MDIYEIGALYVFPALCVVVPIGASLVCQYEWGQQKDGPFKSGRDSVGFLWDLASKVKISDLPHLVEERFIENHYTGIYQNRFRNAQPLLF